MSAVSGRIVSNCPPQGQKRVYWNQTKCALRISHKEEKFYETYHFSCTQRGGTLNGTYQYLDDGSVGVIFDYNGEELRYACIFTWTDEGELLMVAISDVEGADGIYFVQ